MQFRRTIRLFSRFALAVTLSSASIVHAQSVPPPVISPLATGGYSVSYSGCGSCAGHGLEALTPTSSTWEYAGSAAITVSNPVPGQHRYRAVYVIMTGPGSYQPVYGPEASITIGVSTPPTQPARPTLAAQMAAEYFVSSGDINADGLRDLFIRRSTPLPAGGDGTIGDILLRQNAQGSFVTSLLDGQESAIAANWLPAPVRVGKRDANIDGYVDLILQGVDQMPGFAQASNQILMAPGASGITQPPVARAVDAGLARFSADINRHLIDPDYYLENVPTSYALLVYYALNCSWTGYGYADVFDMSVPWSCYREPQYIYVVYRDYSVFDRDAMDIAATDYGMIHDIEPIGTGLQRIAAKIGAILGVTIGGGNINEILGPDAAVSDEQDQLAIGLFGALAAISEAVAQGADGETQPAVTERVELRGRRVLGQGPFHTALQFRQNTVSAFDSDPRPLWDGDLVSEVNWPRDHPSLTLRMGYVDGPTSPLLYWNSLLIMDRRYDDDLPYDLFPSIGQGGYNSNSYVSGIIKASLGTPTIQIESFVGGERPVPLSAFN